MDCLAAVTVRFFFIVMLNNPIQVLKQTELLGHQFTVYGTAENPLFLTKEIADIIEYSASNSSKLTNLVDRDEKVRSIITTPGGNQEVWLLTEDGLYEVLFQSRKPIAKQFKKGVKQILHEVRATGGYIATKQDDTPEEIMARALIVAQDTIKRREERLKQLEEKNAKLQPKAAFADCIMQSNDCISVGEMANILKQNGLFRKGQNALYEWLRWSGYLLSKGARYNLPSQRSISLGIMKIAENAQPQKGNVFINRKAVITPYGQRYFISLFSKGKNVGQCAINFTYK